ncbi:hypothetical protein Ancab_012753 [Ancistrocladus abbreviatus]
MHNDEGVGFDEYAWKTMEDCDQIHPKLLEVVFMVVETRECVSAKLVLGRASRSKGSKLETYKIWNTQTATFGGDHRTQLSVEPNVEGQIDVAREWGLKFIDDITHRIQARIKDGLTNEVWKEKDPPTGTVTQMIEDGNNKTTLLEQYQHIKEEWRPVR